MLPPYTSVVPMTWEEVGDYFPHTRWIPSGSCRSRAGAFLFFFFSIFFFFQGRDRGGGWGGGISHPQRDAQKRGRECGNGQGVSANKVMAK